MIDPHMVDVMKAADSAAFSTHAREFANQLVDESNLRTSEKLRRGRGAGINPVGRFEAVQLEDFDDGWENEDPSCLKTSVQVEKARSIITTNTSPDIHFDRSINPYRGCEHGCIYCFARPTHSYMGLSAGLDFESRLYVKPEAPKLLERELSKPNYKPKVIAIGTNTDPYQPIEKKWQVMREILQVLDHACHPVSITTKSALILRDLDILTSLAQRHLVRVAISITTLDAKLARSMEPRASTPSRRLAALEALSKAGVPVSCIAAPIIPGLNDHELESIMTESAAKGAADVAYIMLRLPYEVAPLFRDWLLREYPDRYRRVMQLIRDMRGGKDYDANWKTRMHGEGVFADLMAKRHAIMREKLGLGKRRFSMSFVGFTPPFKNAEQLSLF